MSTDVLGKWTCGSCTLNAVVEKLPLLKLNRVDFALWNFLKIRLNLGLLTLGHSIPFGSQWLSKVGMLEGENIV